MVPEFDTSRLLSRAIAPVIAGAAGVMIEQFGVSGGLVAVAVAALTVGLCVLLSSATRAADLHAEAAFEAVVGAGHNHSRLERDAKKLTVSD